MLDSLKTAQEKYNDKDKLQHTVSLIEKLFQEHDELDPDDLGELSDASDESNAGDDEEDDGDDNINLDEISDDSGCDVFVVTLQFLLLQSNQVPTDLEIQGIEEVWESR